MLKAKRGQISAKVFVYLLTMIVVIVILTIGYNSLSSTKERIDRTDSTLLKNQLTSDIEIIGKDYPLFFETRKEFLEKLNNLPSNFKWKLPNHDKHFLTYLSAAMRDCIGSGKSK